MDRVGARQALSGPPEVDDLIATGSVDRLKGSAPGERGLGIVRPSNTSFTMQS
jgi:hypothetical protein